jgi:L-lysine 2,3-aminomutase
MSRDVLAKETIEDLTEAIAYIAAHPEIDNVNAMTARARWLSSRNLIWLATFPKD